MLETLTNAPTTSEQRECVQGKEVAYMDMGRCLIPKPERCYKIENNLFYYYIEIDSLSGKLLPLFAYGRYQCNNRSGQQMPVLMFKNEDNRHEFEDWVSKNQKLKEKYIKIISENAIFQHIKSKEERNGSPQCGVLQVALSFAYYRKWIEVKK